MSREDAFTYENIHREEESKSKSKEEDPFGDSFENIGGEE